MLISLHNILDNIHILSTASRLPMDLAHQMNVEEGAIINPILCMIADQATLVLMAGDKACDASQISRVLNLKGAVRMLDSEGVASLTGSNLDKLFPLAMAQDLPIILDASLKRFDLLYSRAGSTKCLIATTFGELKAITGGIISYAVASPTWHPRTLSGE